jgi:hypothetical protein
VYRSLQRIKVTGAIAYPVHCTCRCSSSLASDRAEGEDIASSCLLISHGRDRFGIRNHGDMQSHSRQPPNPICLYWSSPDVVIGLIGRCILSPRYGPRVLPVCYFSAHDRSLGVLIKSSCLFSKYYKPRIKTASTC